VNGWWIAGLSVVVLAALAGCWFHGFKSGVREGEQIGKGKGYAAGKEEGLRAPILRRVVGTETTETGPARDLSAPRIRRAQISRPGADDPTQRTGPRYGREG
jgi:hypothetical protein